MEVSEKLKERFCKDCNIPLRLYKEPYFMDRLQLYDSYYNALDKWNIFVRELDKYKCEQDYLEEYNRVKKYTVKYKDLPGKDIFKTSNNGKLFISIDMRKANFSALKFYNRSIFDNADTWEKFIERYTEDKHIVNSKYIRQVILGICIPKRQVTYE